MRPYYFLMIMTLSIFSYASAASSIPSYPEQPCDQKSCQDQQEQSLDSKEVAPIPIHPCVPLESCFPP